MKKFLSLLLAVMMVVSLCPISALASDMNPMDLSQSAELEEQQEEPLPEQPAPAEEPQPAEEQPVEEQPEEPQQSEMNSLDLSGGEAAPLAEGETGSYYTENGAVIAFDANGIYGCNYTLDNAEHYLYIQNVGINRTVTVTKTYIVRMRAADFSIKNNSSASVNLQNANSALPVDTLEAGEQKAAADLPNIKQVKLATLTATRAAYDITNATEVYYMYIDKVGDENLNAAILIEIIPDSIKVDGSEFAAEKTELTGWNRIKSDGTTERVECSSIYMLTLPYGDENLSLDFDGAAKYAGQALGSEKAEFGNVNFAELLANSDYAVTGDKKAEGVSCTALFGESLPGTLSDRDKVVFIAGYDAEGNAKAGLIARVYVPDVEVAEIATAADLAAFRDYVNAGNTEKSAKLVADIDLSTVCGKDIGNWTPIATYAGTFDGNNHTISNLYIEENDNYASLFDTIEANGTVKNLGVVSATINRTAKSTKAAAIVCRKNEGTITGCYVKDSTVNSFGGRGSLFCDTNRGSISDCFVINGTVNDQGNGIYGRTFAVTNTNNSRVSGTITNCYAVNVKVVTTKSVKDSFVGTTTTANAGVTNCYVLDTDNQTTVNATVKTAEWFKSDEAVAALGDAWQKDADNKNDGFPVLKTQSSGDDKPDTGKNNGIFTVKLEDGTEVYPEKLAIPETFDYKGSTFTFDDKDGHWKIVVPEGTKNIKVKLDKLSITEGLVIDEHCHIGAHGMNQGLGEKYLLNAGDPYYCTQTALDNRVAKAKRPKQKQAIIDASVVDAYEDGWFTLPLEKFAYPNDEEDWLNPYGELDSRYQWAEITVGFVDPAGTTTNAYYQAMILVQIGGDTTGGENTPPVRRSNVAASISMGTDDNLKCEIDLSRVFYDADGDALTYKVRIGEEGEYVPFEGSVYTYTAENWDSSATLYFTANDGKTDGGSYIVKVSVPRTYFFKLIDEVVADPSDYWTEGDEWNGEIGCAGGFYKWFLDRYNYYKKSGDRDHWYGQLADAFRNLIPKSRVNATMLYYAVNEGKAAMKQIDIYTEMSKVGFDDAYNAAIALFADGAIAYEPYSEAKQAEIESVAAALKERVNALVKSDEYKKAFENYQSRKEEAKKLLELYNPEKYTESDYTADSWQAFVAAWNDLKADVDFVFDETSGTTREYEMLKNFEKHMEALPTAFGNLISAVDVTVSFRYIDNMQFRYSVTQQGTNAYMNSELKLAAGSTTVEGAFTAAGITNFTFTTPQYPQIMEGEVSYRDDCLSKPLYALFVNGVYVTTGKLDALKTRQLHNGDKVVLARITSQFSGSEYSSGYDSTTWEYSANYRPNGIEDSVGNIAITSVTQNAKVGETVTIRARARKAFSTTLGGSLDVSGLTLLVSAPAEENVISQNWVTTPITGDENGKIEYVFAEPGYYTIAVVNNKYDIPATNNVYGIESAGTYNTLMIGDFTTVYIAPADDTEALIAEWRAKNLAEAKALFEQYHDYDFKDGFYKSKVVPAYNKLVENQNNAATFKEIVDNYNNDFVNLKNIIEKNLRDHDSIVADMRKNLGYLPEDLSTIDYTYAPVVRAIQNIYNTTMNYYERTLLTQAEIEIVEKILLINVNDLVRPALTTIDVQKDDNVRIQSSPGWLASAPNENRVTQLMANGSTVTGYYKWTTGTGAEPDDTGMGAVAGERVSARRLVVTSDEEYWMAFSIDGGNTWKLADKVAGGEGMFNAVFIMPETEGTLVFSLKMVSKAVYDEMKASAEAPNMDLDNAKASYKAALEEVFASYDKDRYSVENYTSLRYAKENGIANIDSAKSVTAVVKQFNAAIEAMKAVPQKAQVYVEVKNETFTESYVDDSGNTITPPWTGTLVAKWVDIDKDSSMMSSIVKALEGHEVLGAENNYISSIDGLGEFGGGSGSGWMGTLNDWFTNYGFAEFTVANGTLKAGDRISVMYTCTLGSDIGGAVEGNTDTTLKALSAANGKLSPAFDKETMSYTLTMEEGKHTVTLDYTASNKAFQVRTYLNGYDPAAAKYYSVGEAISVKEGDVIYVACGDPSWPSMAGNDALKIVPHVYAITVVGTSGAVEKLIKALPAPEKLAYSDKADVDNAKLLFDALTEEQKAAISEELQDKLAKCVARMAELEKVHAVEELIEALPAKRPLTEEQETKLNEAREAFDALGDLQKDVKQSYINKLLALVGRQAIYFDYQGGKANTKMLYTQNDGKLAVLPETTNGDLHFGGWYTERYGGGTKITLDTIFTDTCMLYAEWLDNTGYVARLIENIGEVELTDECKAKIDEARAEYDKLTDDEKPWVYNYEALTNAEAKYAELLAQRKVDEAAAKAVDDLIAAIGKVELTDECKAKIDAARAAYDKLTDAQKALVSNYDVLTSAEAEYQKLLDQKKADEAAAKAVEDLIAAIGKVELTDECKAKIDAARAAYDKLTDAQKALVSNYDVLTAAEAEYQKLLDQKKADEAAAKAVDDLIAAIGKVELTDASKAKIDAARAAYDKLTDAQKELVKNLKTLTDAEEEYQKLLDQRKADEAAAKAVDEAVAKLTPVTLESGKAIEEARKAFDALTPEQKKLLDPATEGKLVAAENEYKKLVKEDADKKAAKEVEDKIAALQPVTKDSGEAIKDARSSYEALTPEQKDLVSKEALKALEKAEKAYSMIVDSNKPDASDKGDKGDSGVIKITINGASKGEQNPNTGAPAISIAPAMLVLAAAVLVLKKRG